MAVVKARKQALTERQSYQKRLDAPTNSWVKQAALLTKLADRAFAAGDYAVAISAMQRAAECLIIARNMKGLDDAQ